MRPNQSGTLPEAIEITNDFKRNYDPAEVAERAVRAIEVGVMNGTTFFRLFADVGTIGGLRAAQGLLLAREKMKRLLPDPGRGLPAGGHRARSRRRRTDGRGRQGGLRHRRRAALVRVHRRGCAPAHRHLLRDRQAARSRHPHAGGRHRRRELAQPRISRAQDHARGLPGPRRRQPLRRDGRLQRRLRRQDRRHGGDRRRHHLVQRPHQPGLLGAHRPRAQAPRHRAREGTAGARRQRRDRRRTTSTTRTIRSASRTRSNARR